jgi:hypothetical protein
MHLNGKQWLLCGSSVMRQFWVYTLLDSDSEHWMPFCGIQCASMPEQTAQKDPAADQDPITRTLLIHDLLA